MFKYLIFNSLTIETTKEQGSIFYSLLSPQGKDYFLIFITDDQFALKLD